MPVLDTSFLIALESGDEPAERLLKTLHPQPLLVPSIVAVEFLTPYGDEAERALEELARAFHLCHTSKPWMIEASKLRHRLHQEGESIRLVDFWIATWASLHDTSVVTRNARDFEPMGIPLEIW